MTDKDGINFNYRPYATFQVAELTLRHPTEGELKLEGHKAYAAHTMIMTTPERFRQEVLEIIWKQSHGPIADTSGHGQMVNATDVSAARAGGANIPGL